VGNVLEKGSVMGNPQDTPVRTCGVPLMGFRKIAVAIRFGPNHEIIKVYREALFTIVEPRRKKVIDREPNA
jgi:hypothetical protein